MGHEGNQLMYVEIFDIKSKTWYNIKTSGVVPFSKKWKDKN